MIIYILLYTKGNLYLLLAKKNSADFVLRRLNLLWNRIKQNEAFDAKSLDICEKFRVQCITQNPFILCLKGLQDASSVCILGECN
jgi:hypothetical protein